MRITGGRLRGRVFSARRFDNVRPTTDRARETVFNIVQNLVDIDGAHVLDLFAGSGALGFEALSRGAADCTAVEQHRKTADAVEATARELGVADIVRVVRQDVLKFLAQTEGPPDGARFRLVFCDPPYALKAVNRVFSLLAERGLCEAGGLFVAEHDMRETVLVPEGWTHAASRSFGETTVDMFQYSPEAV